MGNLLFSPSGRIGSAQFMSGVNILVIIGLVLSLLPAFSPTLTMLGALGIITYWCWIVLWVKRYHDGGKSGWMCLIPIIVFLVLGTILGMVLQSMFVDVEAMEAATEAATEAAAAGDIAGMLKGALSVGTGMTKMGTIVAAIATAVLSYLIAMVFNNMIKHEPNENRFGPA